MIRSACAGTPSTSTLEAGLAGAFSTRAGRARRCVDPAEAVKVDGQAPGFGMIGDERQERVLDPSLGAEVEDASRAQVQRVAFEPDSDLELQLSPQVDGDREADSGDDGALDVRREGERERERDHADGELGP